jgi:nucleotide-binding universal stress UspA family protein
VILVAWDGSTASAATFPLVTLLGSQLQARVEVLHVLHEGASAQDVRAELQRVGSGRLEDGILRFGRGDVVQEILTAAADPRILVVVLTTHVKPERAGRRLGSVAEGVIVGTDRPVLLVRPEAERSLRALHRLLLPIDGTPKTAEGLRPATDLAARLGASLDLLYVAGPDAAPSEAGSVGAPQYLDHPQHDWPAWEAEVMERLVACTECPASVPVAAYLAHGDVSEEIDHFAVEHDVDAIVLVRRSHLQQGHALTLRAVLRRAPCPVLVVHGPEA